MKPLDYIKDLCDQISRLPHRKKPKVWRCHREHDKESIAQKLIEMGMECPRCHSPRNHTQIFCLKCYRDIMDSPPGGLTNEDLSGTLREGEKP